MFLLNESVIVGRVVKISEQDVEYTLPSENLVISIRKGSVSKIVFASGRVEEFENLLNIKEITSKKQWEDVIVTYNIEDTRGLERVAELSDVSGWGGMVSGVGYNDAIKDLKKDAAKLGCGLIYITNSPNDREGSSMSGVRVNAIAYRIPRKINKTNPKDSLQTAPSSLQPKGDSECNNRKADMNYIALLLKKNIFDESKYKELRQMYNYEELLYIKRKYSLKELESIIDGYCKELERFSIEKSDE